MDEQSDAAAVRIFPPGAPVLTRNPMYLQMVLACIGFAVILSNGWILLLTPLCGWLLQRFAILPEEAYLERKFGDTYLAYKGRVRRWLQRPTDDFHARPFERQFGVDLHR